MLKKQVAIRYDEIVVGSDIRALLYAYKRDVTCLYLPQKTAEVLLQPKNLILKNFFCDENRVSGQSIKEKFLNSENLEYFLLFVLGTAGKLYRIERDNLRYADGNLIHKTNKTEFVLETETINLFNNIKLNGAKHNVISKKCHVEDFFKTNAKSMEKTWFRGHEKFFNYIYFNNTTLKSSFTLKSQDLLNDFDNSVVSVRYEIDDFLKGKEEIILQRDYYVNLMPKIKSREIIQDFEYKTEEDNINVISPSLEEICQQQILPLRESYLYYLSKKILDSIGTTV